jgi:hypothetical protein
MRSSGIEQALAAWREAERNLADASDGDRERLEAEVARTREVFQQLSTEYMINRIESLHDAEARRATETPSTTQFHEAAKEEKQIATEIWDMARLSDEDTPRRPDSDDGGGPSPPVS